MTEKRIYQVIAVSDDRLTLTLEAEFGGETTTITVDRPQPRLDKGHGRFIMLEAPDKDEKEIANDR